MLRGRGVEGKTKGEGCGVLRGRDESGRGVEC